jgi:hypothetical protein
MQSFVIRHSSFNLIHFATGMKVDLFPLSDDPLDVRQLTRRQRVEVVPGAVLWIGAADDQVLRKLRWFRLGGEISERQWRDVISILRVQGDRIQPERLRADAEPLGLGDLVSRALAEIGVEAERLRDPSEQSTIRDDRRP